MCLGYWAAWMICLPCLGADTWALKPAPADLAPGETVRLIVLKNKKEAPCPDNIQFTADPSQGSFDKAACKYTAPPAPGSGLAITGPIEITAKFDQGGPQEIKATVILKTKPEFSGGEAVRAVFGYAQTSASASDPSHSYLIDFFISRPFPWQRNQQVALDNYGPRLRWWGNVRLVSSPRQADIEVAQFLQNFITDAGKVKVNELVQGAEFVTGVEYRLFEFGTALQGSHNYEDQSRQRFSLHFIAAGGAIGPSQPRTRLRIFETPATNSAQYAEFRRRFGAVPYKYTGFTIPDRDRFFRQYFAGMRLKTHYFDAANRPLERPPAILDLAYGQNEAVTRGRLYGGVVRVEAFYPLPFAAQTVYLFGMSCLKLARAQETVPFYLNEAANVQPSNAEVYYINTGQSNRDYYRVGFGLDLVRVLTKRVP